MSLLNAISSHPPLCGFYKSVRDMDCAPEHTSLLFRSRIKRHPRAGQSDLKCLFLSEYRWRHAQDPIYLDAS